MNLRQHRDPGEFRDRWHSNVNKLAFIDMKKKILNFNWKLFQVSTILKNICESTLTMGTRHTEDTNYLLKMPEDSEAANSNLYWNR